MFGAAIKRDEPYIKHEPKCVEDDVDQGNPFRSYIKLGYTDHILTSLVEYIKDELIDSSRPACYFGPLPAKTVISDDNTRECTSHEPPTNNMASTAAETTKYWPWKTTECATISTNLLKDFMQTLYVFEDFIIFGWMTCVCHLLYDVCISPIHASVVLFRLLQYCFNALVNGLYQVLYSASPRLALHTTADTLVKPLYSLLGRGTTNSATPSNQTPRVSVSRRFSQNQSRRLSLSCDIPTSRDRYRSSCNRQRAKSTLASDTQDEFQDTMPQLNLDAAALSTDPLPIMPSGDDKLATFPTKGPPLLESVPKESCSRSQGIFTSLHERLRLKINPDLIVSEPKSAENNQTGTFNDIAASDITSLMIVSIGLTTFIIFRSVFDVSGVYHFIRGQSLLKLYVAFNMLEIVERMWRSFELDVFDNLRVHIDRTTSSFTHTDLCHHRVSNAMGLLARFILAVICASVHTIMHLLRGLLLCIAMNSEESAMFLIIVTNNFAEIKSTVFKKQTGSTLWVLAVGDVLERVHLCADALFVYLQTSFSPQFAIASSFLVLRWLGMMLALEIVVDFFKHSFLIKFNSISSSIFKDFKKVMMMDVLIARCPTLALSSTPRMTNVTIPVPSQGLSAFPSVATRRIGLNTIPILTLFLQSIPYTRFFNSGNALFGGIVLGLTWLALVGTLIILQLILFNISIIKIGREIPVNETFSKLRPL